MAILAVVLFVLLFVGVGGFGWFYVRTQRARRDAELRQVEEARFEAEAQRRRVEAELAETEAVKEQAEQAAPTEVP
jgi:uncharacterized protein HemX